MFYDPKAPVVLDLFCGAGGASMGYYQAGFSVLGVDNRKQRRYPFPFIKADAMDVLMGLKVLIDNDQPIPFQVIHASPPCQAYTDGAKSSGTSADHPDMIAAVRALLWDLRVPYVIENVDTAPLWFPMLLCGTMFPDTRVVRHRLFECNVQLNEPPHINKGAHPITYTTRKDRPQYGKIDPTDSYVTVAGGGNAPLFQMQQAMGIDWMSRREIVQAVPPAYTRYIGEQLLTLEPWRQLDGRSASARQGPVAPLVSSLTRDRRAVRTGASRA